MSKSQRGIEVSAEVDRSHWPQKRVHPNNGKQEEKQTGGLERYLYRYDNQPATPIARLNSGPDTAMRISCRGAAAAASGLTHI